MIAELWIIEEIGRTRMEMESDDDFGPRDILNAPSWSVPCIFTAASKSSARASGNPSVKVKRP